MTDQSGSEQLGWPEEGSAARVWAVKESSGSAPWLSFLQEKTP